MSIQVQFIHYGVSRCTTLRAALSLFVFIFLLFFSLAPNAMAAAAPAITSATTASGTVGKAFSYQIAATNTPTRYAATGLPAGLALNSTTGLISGTPTASGTYSLTLSATNKSGTAKTTLALTLSPTSFFAQSAANVLPGTAPSLSFAHNTVAGDLIMVGIDFDGTASPSSVSDTQGNTFVQVASQLTSPEGTGSRVYYAKNIKGGADTVTVHWSVTSANVEIYLTEYAGLDLNNPVDAQAGATGTAGAVSSGFATTTVSGDIIYGYCVGDSACTVGSGFTARSTYDQNLIEDQLTGAPGAYAATGSATNGWSMQMVALKPASSKSASLLQTVGNGVPGTAPSLSFVNNTVAGDLIMVGFDFDGTASPSSVSDTQGNTFVQVGTQLMSPQGTGSRVYYAKNIKGGADTVTVHWSVASSNVEIYLSEYAGLSQTSPVDAQAGATGPAGAVSSGNATTTVSADIIYGYCVGDSACTVGSGFTARSTYDQNLIEDKTAGSPGAYAALGSATNSWSMQMVALKPASTGGTSGNTSPAASLSATSLSFASQTVGAASPAQTVTLTNSGTAALSISSITLAGTNTSDFAQTNNCGSGLAAGANCTFSVTFKPTASGSRTAAITLTDNATGGAQSVSLSGTGASGSATASLSTSSLTFGNVPVAVTSSSQVVTLTNTGTATLNISGINFTGTNAADFAEADTCSPSVAAGGTCTIAVLFTPVAAGTRTASLSIADNATGSPQPVTLSGAGNHDVLLSWNASATTGIAGYNIYRGTTVGGESSTPLNSTPTSATGFTDQSVTSGTTYYYVVTAVTSGGATAGTASNETSATVPTP